METGPEFVQGSAMVWEPGTPSVPNLHRRRATDRAPGSAPAVTREFPAHTAEPRSAERNAEIEAALADATSGPRPHETFSPDAFGDSMPPLPWYIEAGHALRTDTRIHVLFVLVLVTLAAVALWPRPEKPTSLAGIRKHAGHFDGEQVQVSGRVGQVFQVGGGYAFYLLQGGDTLVVFTRTRKPVERQHVHVHGTMSNGAIDGQPTLALFEETGGH